MKMIKAFLTAGTEVLAVRIPDSLCLRLFEIFYKKLDEKCQLFLIKRLRIEGVHVDFGVLLRKLEERSRYDAVLNENDICHFLTESSTDSRSAGGSGTRTECGVGADVRYHGSYQ